MFVVPWSSVKLTVQENNSARLSLSARTAQDTSNLGESLAIPEPMG
jgi:hypothetical protein